MNVTLEPYVHSRLLNFNFRLPCEEFQREIDTSVPRAAGREMDCHILQGAWDFHEWLDPLGVKVQGLTITDKAPNVIYCYRIVRREDLMKYGGHKQWIIEQDSAQCHAMSKNTLQ